MKYAIVSVRLQIPCPNAKTREDMIEEAENYELPKEYIEDSFQLMGGIDE